MSEVFKKHYKIVEAPLLPTDIAPFLHRYTFFRLVRNYPVSTYVYKAIKTGYPTLFLKIGKSLESERKRLSWLKKKLLVPSVIAYSSFENQEFLLLTEVTGLPADDKKWLANIASMVSLLAEQVHVIHSLPSIGCPFNKRLDILMTNAEKIVQHQLLDSRYLSKVYRHRTINDLYDNLLQLCPAKEYIVFTHGDLCLPNILIRQETSAGFVDWGEAGLSDPHRDLALLAYSIRSNFSKKYVKLFFDAYGCQVDEQKLEFYKLLDQFTIARCKQNTVLTQPKQ